MPALATRLMHPFWPNIVEPPETIRPWPIEIIINKHEEPPTNFLGEPRRVPLPEPNMLRRLSGFLTTGQLQRYGNEYQETLKIGETRPPYHPGKFRPQMNRLQVQPMDCPIYRSCSRCTKPPSHPRSLVANLSQAPNLQEKKRGARIAQSEKTKLRVPRRKYGELSPFLDFAQTRPAICSYRVHPKLRRKPNSCCSS